MPSLRDRVKSLSMKGEINSLLAAVVDAYLTRRAGVAVLRAVLKLHCIFDPGSEGWRPPPFSPGCPVGPCDRSNHYGESEFDFSLMGVVE